MAKQYDSEDNFEKSSRSSNKKNKNRPKHRMAEGETRGMQKKTNFKRYLQDVLEQESFGDDEYESDEE